MIGGIFKKEFFCIPTLRIWYGEFYNIVVEINWLNFYLVLYREKKEEKQIKEGINNGKMDKG